MFYTIYTITCKDIFILDTYVGKTSTNPKQRFSNHKHLSLSSHRKLYNIINKHGGIENCNFNIIEQCHTLDVNLSKEREEYYCKSMMPTMNTYVPNRGVKQWRIDNRESYNEYMRTYFKKRNLYKKELKFYMNL